MLLGQDTQEILTKENEMVPELVALYLDLDRAIGKIVEFLGIDQASMSDGDKKSLADAEAKLDAAGEALQKAIYKQCGMQ